MEKEPRLVASAKRGTHEVLLYRRKGYVRRYVYARVRKETFVEPPTHKAFMAAVFRIAHNILELNKRIDEESQNE